MTDQSSNQCQRRYESREGACSPLGTGRVTKGIISGLGGLALVIATESGFLEFGRGQVQRPTDAVEQGKAQLHIPKSIDQVLSDRRNALQTFKAWGRETAHALNTSTKESMVYQVPPELLSGFKSKARKLPLIYFSDLISRGKNLERKIYRTATPQDIALVDQARKKYPGIAYAIAYLAGVSEGPSLGWSFFGMPTRFKNAGLVFYIGHPPKTDKIVLALDASDKTTGKAFAKSPSAVAVFDDGPAERYFTSVVLATIAKTISSRHTTNSYMR